jgi:phage shock protein A
VTSELVNAIKDFGFPIVAAMGLGYFVYYVWQWVTTEIKPVVSEASTTLIKLVDRIRMLDNDMIRLNTKLAMVLEYYQQKGMKADKDLDEIITRYSTKSESFDSTGKKPDPKK